MESLICTINTRELKNNLINLDFPIFMVKADCYGHGIELIKYAEKYVTAFGVATELEGVKLRRITNKPILVTAPDIAMAHLYDNYALTPLVGSLELSEKISYYNKRIRLHIKVDCGMGRFGFNSLKDLCGFCKYAKGKGLSVKGIGSHIPSYDSKEISKKRFGEYIEVAESYFGRLLRHIEASSTSSDKDFDIQRIGLLAYKNVMTLEGRIACIKRIDKGDNVGYNHIYTAKGKEVIAVVYGGYADGIPRSSVGFNVIINGISCPVIAVCMDVFMVRLTCHASVGDKVVIFSTYKGVESLAERSGRIPYEILTGVGRRCKYVYKE